MGDYHDSPAQEADEAEQNAKLWAEQDRMREESSRLENCLVGKTISKIISKGGKNKCWGFYVYFIDGTKIEIDNDVYLGITLKSYSI